MTTIRHMIHPGQVHFKQTLNILIMLLNSLLLPSKKDKPRKSKTSENFKSYTLSIRTSRWQNFLVFINSYPTHEILPGLSPRKQGRWSEDACILNFTCIFYYLLVWNGWGSGGISIALWPTKAKPKLRDSFSEEGCKVPEMILNGAFLQ